jgi:GNAT superfamily N-acetyltransferase
MSAFKIREATEEDIPQMLVNGEAFLKEIGANSVYFDPTSVRAVLLDCMASRLCFIAVDEAGLHLGGIGAVVAQMPFNESILLSIERFWWMVPGDRARGVGQQLLTALKERSKELDCDRLIMIALVNDTLPYVEKAYEKFGLTPIERTYMLRL